MSSKNVLVSAIKKLAKSGGELCASAVGIQSAESGCCGTAQPAEDLPADATRPADPQHP